MEEIMFKCFHIPKVNSTICLDDANVRTVTRNHGNIHDEEYKKIKDGAFEAAEAMFQGNSGIQFADVYEPNCIVGHGAFGKVYKCTHRVGTFL